MKKIFSAMVAAAVTPCVVTPAMAANWGGDGWNDDGVYARAQGGWSSIDDNSYNSAAGRIHTKYDDGGWLAGGAVGYKKGPMRYEIEGIHQETEVKRHSVGNFSLPNPSGDLKVDAAMANVYYDFGNGRIRPYVGGGVGGARVKADNFTGGGSTFLDDDDTVLAYQGMAGVSYQINPCWSVNAEYRYLGGNDAEVTTRAGVHSKMAYDSNNVVVGLTYKF